MWEPTKEQLTDWQTKGYFIIRGAIPRDNAIEMRGVLKDFLLRPEPGLKTDADPMDPMGDTPQARAARFRKLSGFGPRLPLIWHYYYGSEAMTSVARYFLFDNIFLKFNSCFVKPARTGSATPWHQDNGLWRDGETEPFNFWMALDPATTENGCLQFIPGSHKLEILPHVLYADSIHAELPREQVRQLIAGVYTTPQITRQRRFGEAFYWVLRDGELCTAFPPQQVDIPKVSAPGAFPAAEAVSAPVG